MKQRHAAEAAAAAAAKAAAAAACSRGMQLQQQKQKQQQQKHYKHSTAVFGHTVVAVAAVSIAATAASYRINLPEAIIALYFIDGKSEQLVRGSVRACVNAFVRANIVQI